MKTAILLLLAIFVLFFNSCKKSNPSPTVVYSMTFKVDGVQKTFTSLYANLLRDSLLVLNAGEGKESITLNMNRLKAKVGTFDAAKHALYGADSTTVYVAQQGNITINSLSDQNVSGTFQFIGSYPLSSVTKTITEGKFTSKLAKF